MSNLPTEFEPTTHTYSRGASLLCDAARKFDLEVSDEQADKWRSIFVAMHKLDGLLDSNKPYTERSTQYDDMIDVIMGDAKHICAAGCYACDLQVHMGAAPIEQRGIFKINTELIKVLGEDRRASTKVRQLGHLSIEEGRMSAELLKLYDKSRQANAFNSWLGNVGIFGAVIDTAIDLPSDYKTGLTSVRPIVSNRLALASMGLPYATRVACHMNLSLARSLTKAFFAVSEDRSKDIIQQVA